MLSLWVLLFPEEACVSMYTIETWRHVRIRDERAPNIEQAKTIRYVSILVRADALATMAVFAATVMRLKAAGF